MGGLAAQAISSVLGVKPEPKSMEKALQSATPEQLAEIKKIRVGIQGSNERIRY